MRQNADEGLVLGILTASWRTATVENRLKTSKSCARQKLRHWTGFHANRRAGMILRRRNNIKRLPA
jgi:hypothetical protein